MQASRSKAILWQDYLLCDAVWNNGIEEKEEKEKVTY